MNQLYLVRHGENLANITLEFSHRKVDYSLTSKGVLQASQTAEYFRDKQIHEVYTSPLKRAFETAQLIAEPLGLPVKVVEAFREVNVGELEGQKPTAALWARHNAIIAAWEDGHPETCFPGGEDYPTLLGRIRTGLEKILPGKDGRGIIIVGHGGIFSFTLRDLCSGIDRTVMSGGMPNCAVTHLEARLAGSRLEVRLLSFATTEHLSGEAARLVSGLLDENSTLEPE